MYKGSTSPLGFYYPCVITACCIIIWAMRIKQTLKSKKNQKKSNNKKGIQWCDELTGNANYNMVRGVSLRMAMNKEDSFRIAGMHYMIAIPDIKMEWGKKEWSYLLFIIWSFNSDSHSNSIHLTSNIP